MSGGEEAFGKTMGLLVGSLVFGGALFSTVFGSCEFYESGKSLRCANSFTVMEFERFPQARRLAIFNADVAICGVSEDRWFDITKVFPELESIVFGDSVVQRQFCR